MRGSLSPSSHADVACWQADKAAKRDAQAFADKLMAEADERERRYDKIIKQQKEQQEHDRRAVKMEYETMRQKVKH